MVGWPQLGIDRVFTACSARQAREILLQNAVDILLSDIEMPEESGLELYAWVRQQDMDVDCIFLTSHAEFEYAQTAISLGSVDYILQPAKMEDVEKAVSKAVTQRSRRMQLLNLEESRNMLQGQRRVLLDQILDAALRGDAPSGRNDRTERADDQLVISMIMQEHYDEGACYPAGIEVTRWLKSLWDPELLRMVIVNVIGELLENEPCEVLTGCLSQEEYIVLIHYDTTRLERAKIEEVLRIFYEFIQAKQDFRIAVYEGESFYKDEELRPALQAIRRVQENNVAGIEQLFSAGYEAERKLDPTQLHPERWSSQIQEGQGEFICSGLEEAFAGHAQELDLEVMKQIHSLYLRALISASNRNDLNYDGFFDRPEDYRAFMNSYTECRKFLTWVRYTVERYNNGIGADSSSRIELVKAYIADHLSKTLSRAEVARYAGYNEEYFSRWFNKETGQTFKEYVLQARMDYARQLLIHTSFPVSTIASKIGIDNFSYFSKMFRREEGVTPQEYRKQHTAD